MKIQFGSGARSEPEEGGVRIDQMAVINAISKEISKQHKKLPVNPRQFNAIIAAANLVVDAFAKPDVKATPGMGLEAWLASDDVGMSSKFMAYKLSVALPGGWPMGAGLPENAYPRDPDDLGRCIRLTQAVPQFESLLFEMREHGKEWKAVAENWDRWEAMYDDEDDDGSALYDEMQAAYK